MIEGGIHACVGLISKLTEELLNMNGKLSRKFNNTYLARSTEKKDRANVTFNTVFLCTSCVFLRHKYVKTRRKKDRGTVI